MRELTFDEIQTVAGGDYSTNPCWCITPTSSKRCTTAKNSVPDGGVIAAIQSCCGPAGSPPTSAKYIIGYGSNDDNLGWLTGTCTNT